jgi:hypothetical protein
MSAVDQRRLGFERLQRSAPICIRNSRIQPLKLLVKWRPEKLRKKQERAPPLRFNRVRCASDHHDQFPR